MIKEEIKILLKPLYKEVTKPKISRLEKRYRRKLPKGKLFEL